MNAISCYEYLTKKSIYNQKHYTPLLHAEIADSMKSSMQQKMIQNLILINEGYVIQPMKERINVTSKGKKYLIY